MIVKPKLTTIPPINNRIVRLLRKHTNPNLLKALSNRLNTDCIDAVRRITSNVAQQAT